jgi:hypothetical protein
MPSLLKKLAAGSIFLTLFYVFFTSLSEAAPAQGQEAGWQLRQKQAALSGMTVCITRQAVKLIGVDWKWGGAL